MTSWRTHNRLTRLRNIPWGFQKRKISTVQRVGDRGGIDTRGEIWPRGNESGGKEKRNLSILRETFSIIFQWIVRIRIKDHITQSTLYFVLEFYKTRWSDHGTNDLLLSSTSKKYILAYQRSSSDQSLPSSWDPLSKEFCRKWRSLGSGQLRPRRRKPFEVPTSFHLCTALHCPIVLPRCSPSILPRSLTAPSKAAVLPFPSWKGNPRS